MFNKLKSRAIVIVMALAIAMVSILGAVDIGAVDTTLAEEFTLNITDDFEPMDDYNTYSTGWFEFNVTDWYEGDMPDTAEYTAVLSINDGAIEENLVYNSTFDAWVYTLMNPPAGEHSWNINITNTTSMDSAVMMNDTMTKLTVRDPPSAMDVQEVNIAEGATLTWNITGADYFDPDDLTIGTPVAVAGHTDVITITEVDDPDYVIYDMTIDEDFEDEGGYVWVNVTGTDPWGVSATQTVNVTIDPINDPPSIEYLMVGEDQVDYEMWNYTWESLLGNMSEMREVFNVTLEEEGNITFMVSAMDPDTNMTLLTVELSFDSLLFGAPVTVEKTDAEGTEDFLPYNFTITGDMDETGNYWGTLEVSDGEYTDEKWVYLMIEDVNDPPTGSFDMISVGDQLDRETDEEVNVSVTVSDIETETEDLTVNWYIDGEMVADWNEHYFLYEWQEAGLYNVSAVVTDGDLEYDIGYFHVNVEEAITFTEEQLTKEYTDEADDVTMMEVKLTADFMNFTAESVYKGSMPEFDIIKISSSMEGENLIVTMELGGAPDVETGSYYIYLVKSSFQQFDFDENKPEEFDPEPGEGDYYDIFSWGYASYEGFGDDGDPTVDGNTITFTIPLSELINAGVDGDDFEIYGYTQGAKGDLASLSITSAFDAAGHGAADVTLGPKEEDDDGSLLWLWILIAIIVILVIVVIIILVVKGGKKEEEETAGAEEPTEESMEGGEMPEQEPGMEQQYGMEQTMPEEQPGMEQAMPEQQYGMEQAMPEEQPGMEQAMPEEQPGMEQAMPEEQPGMEQAMPEQPPAPEQPPQQPPQQPAPPQPPQQQPPQPPQPPQAPETQGEQEQQ